MLPKIWQRSPLPPLPLRSHRLITYEQCVEHNKTSSEQLHHRSLRCLPVVYQLYLFMSCQFDSLYNSRYSWTSTILTSSNATTARGGFIPTPPNLSSWNANIQSVRSVSLPTKAKERNPSCAINIRANNFSSILLSMSIFKMLWFDWSRILTRKRVKYRAILQEWASTLRC